MNNKKYFVPNFPTYRPTNLELMNESPSADSIMADCLTTKQQHVDNNNNSTANNTTTTTQKTTTVEQEQQLHLSTTHLSQSHHSMGAAIFYCGSALLLLLIGTDTFQNGRRTWRRWVFEQLRVARVKQFDASVGRRRVHLVGGVSVSVWGNKWWRLIFIADFTIY